jgi:glycerol-3-phosphate dehydrogenase
LQFENIEVENLKRRPKYIKTNTLSTQQLDELIKTDSRYGKIICRCENITEGEIIDAINSPLKPTSIDAIKRRTRAGMGRCQGGFCALKVMELISKERNIPLDKICKENIGSEIIVGDIE